MLHWHAADAVREPWRLGTILHTQHLWMLPWVYRALLPHSVPYTSAHHANLAGGDREGQRDQPRDDERQGEEAQPEAGARVPTRLRAGEGGGRFDPRHENPSSTRPIARSTGPIPPGAAGLILRPSIVPKDGNL